MTDVTATDGGWHFICASWRALGGEWKVMKDGEVVDGGAGLAVDRRVAAGGLIVLGQEQDQEGGRFSAAESFQGQMTRLNVWAHALTQQEVAALGASCRPYFGNILTWSDVHSGLRGQIKVTSRTNSSALANFSQVSELEFCQTCPRLQPPPSGAVLVKGAHKVLKWQM